MRALPEHVRKRLAPLLLVAAGGGAYAVAEPSMPRERAVVLDFGGAAPEITEVELVFSRPNTPAEGAAVTTQWRFALGKAPRKLNAEVRLASGEWDADVTVERAGRAEPTTHWSSRVNLSRSAWWKRDTLAETSVVLPLREALR